LQASNYPSGQNTLLILQASNLSINPLFFTPFPALKLLIHNGFIPNDVQAGGVTFANRRKLLAIG
jgi:hypothetical protein